MALFSECSLKCARKKLDTADIVREAIYRQSSPLFKLLLRGLPVERVDFLAAGVAGH